MARRWCWTLPIRVDLVGFHAAASRRLASAGKAAGVRHFVILSAVGADRMVLSDFFLAKITQESLVRTSGIPYSIVRTTPLFEQIYRVVEGDLSPDELVRLPPVPMQPIAAVDVGELVAGAALSRPINDVMEIGGPEVHLLPELVQTMLTLNEDGRELVSDPQALLYGVSFGAEAIVPRQRKTLATTSFEDWVRELVARR